MGSLETEAILGRMQRLAAHCAAYRRRVSEALKGTAHQEADTSPLAQQFLFTLAAAFEVCLSDYAVACVRVDCTTLEADLERRVQDRTKGRYAGCLARHVNRISLGKAGHLSTAQAAEILSQDGTNVSFKDARDFVRRCGMWLSPPYCDIVAALSDDDRRVIDTVRAIRHLLAHGDSRASEEVNRQLAHLDQGPPNEHLGSEGRRVAALGAFLKAETAGRSRFERYCDRLADLAGT